MAITSGQVNLLLARLSNGGYRSTQQKLDWLYDNGINVNVLDELANVTRAQLTVALARLEEQANNGTSQGSQSRTGN